MPSTIQELLNRSRSELLDLSTRNRLLSIPVDSKSARLIHIHDELSEEVFHSLVRDKKSLSFLPGRQSNPPATQSGATRVFNDEADAEEIGLPQPEPDEVQIGGIAKRHLDLRLQTALSSEGLQRRLLSLYHESQTMIEEQGVNILYLAMGHLKWYEIEQSDIPRFAPLILIPVELHRKSASERFYIRWREDDLQDNLSLLARLRQDFGVELPPFPEDEDFSPEEYFAQVSKSVMGGKNWGVLPNSMTLGFFSFAKFLMYRDLDAETWPEPSMLLEYPLLKALLRDGFESPESEISETVDLDIMIPVSNLDHVVDADSSQTIAIEMIRAGRNLVIQGPPGTGKSQSITNIIASVVLDGKKVLFVAEKLAALEVVKRRLEREGLGSICLELHSNKANKRAVIEEIGRTWKAGRPRDIGLEKLIPSLESLRALLNQHAQSINEEYGQSGLTPFMMMGRLVQLGEVADEARDLFFENATSWTRDERHDRQKLLLELAERVDQMGSPSQHPWRGVRKDVFLQIDLPPLQSSIKTLTGELDALYQITQFFTASIGRPIAHTLSQMLQEQKIGEYIVQAPELDKEALKNGIWNAGVDGLQSLIESGRKFSSIFSSIGASVKETAWRGDFTSVQHSVKTKGKSIFRILDSNYRNAVKQVRDALKTELPKSYDERLSLLGQIISGQKAYKEIQRSNSTGKAAFGQLWKIEKSDWNHLEAIITWFSGHSQIGLQTGFQQAVASIDDPSKVVTVVKELASRVASTKDLIERLFEWLNLDCEVAFGQAQIGDIDLISMKERCNFWCSHLEELSRWINYYQRAQRARSLDLSPLVDRLETGAILPGHLQASFDRVYCSQLLREVVRTKPELAYFDGMLHEKHINEFRELDKQRLTLAKYRVLLANFNQLPPFSGVGPAGIVRGEIERKRGHRTVRRLLKDAGSIVQAVKPVFMMSPLSVAQFLEPGAVSFDILVIDEASQVQPVDALGAIARCSQIVVVGDNKQLPPTRFFSRLTSDSDNNEEDDESVGVEAKDIESILGLCSARGLPDSMLRWHYRSRHHSLIAVSNQEFYENKLFIVPSPYSATADLGLKFNFVRDGIFDSGASKTNRSEAREICKAILKHAQETPDLSLGVATFSIHQKQAILDELELVRRQNPAVESFFSKQTSEPFFVKNLENVQGDERDVIFISVGYARDNTGFMAMRFGPLGAEGGERRLNVLISRAKRRCEVFSSIVADDIDLERAKGRGVAALKAFLSFTQTGRLGIAKASGRGEDSPFEEFVRAAIESLGYEVHTQVGIAGFFVDLAIVDRDLNGRYLLGIECDGATYHSSRSARERDRLRQAVLEDHGWIIHRIWSTDWFQRPAEQLRKVAEAIERVKSILEDRSSEEPRTSTHLTVSAESSDGFEREVILELEHNQFDGLAVEYKEAAFDVPRHLEPHKLATKAMAGILLKIIEIEGPIHEGELLSRVRDLWKLGRAGSRIKDLVRKAIRSMIANNQCAKEDGFLSIPHRNTPIRNRDNVSSSTLRKPEMLPPSEIQAAILKIVEVHHGASKIELPTAVARVFGFKSTSAQLRDLVKSQISRLMREQVIEEKDEMLLIAKTDSVS